MKAPDSNDSNAPFGGVPDGKTVDKGVKSGEKEPSEAKKPPSLEEKLLELTELLQRTRAEFENYQKRVEKEKTAIAQYAKAEALQQLLPIVDSLEHALEKGSEAEKKAVEPVAKQTRELLQKMGVHPILSSGKKLDASLHDCVLVQSNPQEPDGIVLQELHKGYYWNGLVLRHAKVIVNKIEHKKTENEKESAPTTEEKK